MREHSIEAYKRVIGELDASIEILCSSHGRASVTDVLALARLSGKGYRVLVVALAIRSGYRVVNEGSGVTIYDW